MKVEGGKQFFVLSSYNFPLSTLTLVPLWSPSRVRPRGSAVDIRE